MLILFTAKSSVSCRFLHGSENQGLTFGFRHFTPSRLCEQLLENQPFALT
jgi:hypothetical protein